MYDKYVRTERRLLVAAHQLCGAPPRIVPSNGRLVFVTPDKALIDCHYVLPVKSLTQKHLDDKVYGDELAPPTFNMQYKCRSAWDRTGASTSIGFERLTPCFFRCWLLPMPIPHWAQSNTKSANNHRCTS